MDEEAFGYIADKMAERIFKKKKNFELANRKKTKAPIVFKDDDDLPADGLPPSKIQQNRTKKQGPGRQKRRTQRPRRRRQTVLGRIESRRSSKLRKVIQRKLMMQ